MTHRAIRKHLRNLRRSPLLLLGAIAARYRARTRRWEVKPWTDEAVEDVQRRLERYYAGPGRSEAIRIEVLPGGRTARFSWVQPALPAGRRPFSLGSFLITVAVGLVLLVLAIGVAGMRPEPSALTLFWGPAIRDHAPVLLCIGPGLEGHLLQPGPAQPVVSRFGSEPRLASVAGAEMLVNRADALALVQVSGILAVRDKPQQIRGVDQVFAADLPEHPAVLVGAFNNVWSMKLTGGLRYRFRETNGGQDRCVEDGASPQLRAWCASDVPPAAGAAEDYGVISRVFHPETGRLLVVLGGLTFQGTFAAGQLVTSPEMLRSAVAKLPPDWYRRNLQIVFATKIAESPTQLRVVAAHSW